VRMCACVRCVCVLSWHSQANRTLVFVEPVRGVGVARQGLLVVSGGVALANPEGKGGV
jgi:hypothetical protein